MSLIRLTTVTAPAAPAATKDVIWAQADTPDQLHYKDSAGNDRIIAVKPAVATSTVAAPTLTASLVGVMMGLAGAITPVVTGRVLIVVNGDIANNTIADGANVQLRHGTGAAPANGAALTGTTDGPLVKFVASTAAGKVPFSLSWIVTGLTVGTAIWIDVGLAAVTGGNASIADVAIVAHEL